MNDLKDFESELRATLVELEAAAAPPAGLAERLVANATTGRRGTVHRVDVRAHRWIPPLLAAAAVVAVVAGGAAVLTTTRADHRSPATQVPTQSATSPSTATTPTPIKSVDALVPKGTAVPAGFAAAAVSFRDADNGYALGNVPCSGDPGYCATLVRTTDGGTTWLRIPLPSGLTPVDDKGYESGGGSCGTNGDAHGPCVDKVVFGDALHGFVFSLHDLFITDDGGNTWREEPLRVSSLVVQGGNVVRLGPLHDCSSGCEVPVYRGTFDSTWTKSELPDGPPIIGSKLVVSGTTIYLMAFRPEAQDPYSLYRSSDGAATWQLVNHDVCEGSIAPASNDTVTCDTGDPARPMQTAGTISYRLSSDGTTVEISSDGGKNFTSRSF